MQSISEAFLLLFGAKYLKILQHEYAQQEENIWE